MGSFSARTLLPGAIAGALSFMFGLLVSVPIVQPGDDRTIFETDGGEELPYWTLNGEETQLAEWKVSGWAYLRTHLVSIQGTYEERGTSTGIEFVADPALYVYAIPIVLLVGAGYVLAGGPTSADAGAALLRGTSVAVGYVPTAAASIVLLSWETSNEAGTKTASAAPDLWSALFMTALVAVVCGGIGGYLNHQFGSR